MQLVALQKYAPSQNGGNLGMRIGLLNAHAYMMNLSSSIHRPLTSTCMGTPFIMQGVPYHI